MPRFELPFQHSDEKFSSEKARGIKTKFRGIIRLRVSGRREKTNSHGMALIRPAILGVYADILC